MLHSLTKKYIMALTGLGWSLFVLIHMSGNLLVFKGAEAYNAYGHKIVTSPIYPLAAVGLPLLFLVHVGFAIWLSIENKRARPIGYSMATNGKKAASLASKSMTWTGTFMAAFIILHVATFKYGTVYMTEVHGESMRDLHKLIVEVFQQPGYLAWYALCLVLVGLHLSHGVKSAFQSLGLNQPRFECPLKIFSWIYGFVVGAGFLALPVYVFFFYNGQG